MAAAVDDKWVCAEEIYRRVGELVKKRRDEMDEKMQGGMGWKECSDLFAMRSCPFCGDVWYASPYRCVTFSPPRIYAFLPYSRSDRML